MLATRIAVPLQPKIPIYVLQSGEMLIGRAIQLLLVCALKALHLHLESQFRDVRHGFFLYLHIAHHVVAIAMAAPVGYSLTEPPFNHRP